jgi:hypothetical protein
MEKSERVKVKGMVDLAIELNDKRIRHIQEFLDNLPLDTEINQTVSLELSSAMMFIEQDSQELRDRFNKL